MVEWIADSLSLLFTGSVIALVLSLILAGIVRMWTGARGRAIHVLTVLSGGGAMAGLVGLGMGAEFGLGSLAGLIAGMVAGLAWLIGAAVARVRPAWVDLLVILSGVAYFAIYAEMAESAGAVPPVFGGINGPFHDPPLGEAP